MKNLSDEIKTIKNSWINFSLKFFLPGKYCVHIGDQILGWSLVNPGGIKLTYITSVFSAWKKFEPRSNQPMHSWIGIYLPRVATSTFYDTPPAKYNMKR